jgi:hypothetical protein
MDSAAAGPMFKTGIAQKINLRIVACFSRPESHHQQATLRTPFTTNPPAKNHVKNSRSVPKPPLKTGMAAWKPSPFLIGGITFRPSFDAMAG